MISEDVQTILRQFFVDDNVLAKISETMEAEFELGLEKGTPTSSIAMLPSFVPQLPDGCESGKYVAIDLSGKNLRLMLLTLNGHDKEPESITNNFMIQESVMKGTGDQLFSFIVSCLHKFLTGQNLLDAHLPIGFVFSYPCQLLSIRSARLLWWTKGFDIKDCLQKDVVSLLENALSQDKSIKVEIKAIMNDTVGQLAAATYKHGPDCVIGVVIGYGCNSSYLEQTAKIKKFDSNKAGYTHDQMVIVTEWEEFGEKGELNGILTKFDQEIDAVSVHKGKQIVDKLTGALYLGELARLILAELTEKGLLFGAQPCERLGYRDAFPTKYLSEILSDNEENCFKNCRRICDELEVPNHGTADYLIIKEVCHTISQRSASIVAAAISALLRHMGRDKVKIGIGGALIQFHPTYHQLLNDKLVILAPSNVEWDLVPADEGSAQGAAIIAAVVEKLRL